MKNRTRKRLIDWRHKLPREFVFVRTAEELAWESMVPVGREFGSPDYERLTQLDNQVICARCEALGLSIAHAQRLAAAADDADPQSILWVLGLDLVTLAPLKPRRWLWMAAQTSSVSYRGILTPETLLEILTTRIVPPVFASHVLHLLDEAPIQYMVLAVEQAAQQSGMPIEAIWLNLQLISEEMQSRRKGVWTMDKEAFK